MTKSFVIPGVSRRVFLGTAAAATGATMLPVWPAQAKAKYTRYSATSPQGQAMLASYAIAVNRMLTLPSTDTRNWFRNAFVHAMDCPHGNWWFFVWHRPFLGYFEQTLRDLSGNPDFAIPYWDWTAQARIPAPMFDGVLDPTNIAYKPFLDTFEKFKAAMNPGLVPYWKSLSPAQLAQLNTRGMPTLDSLWQQVRGNQNIGAMYAPWQHGRWLTKANPWLDDKTKVTVSHDTIVKGLAPDTFDGFNSAQSASHNDAPSGSGAFAILEGQPHNKTHNNIGGVGYISWRGYGYMADNLSPVDPVFFLHHSNMDRLWDVWTRKQKAEGKPDRPVGAQWDTFGREPFLFYRDAKGQPTSRKTAAQSFDIGDFDYSYTPGSGEEIVKPSPVAVAAAMPALHGTVGAAGATVAAPSDLVAKAAGRTIVASITVPHPMDASSPREFDVLVNAPPGTTGAGPGSPFFVGTISFFGFMPHMAHGDATFQIPLSQLPPALKGAPPGSLTFTVVPSSAPIATGGVMSMAPGAKPLVRAASVSVLD